MFRDRAACLRHSPIEFYASNVTLRVLESPKPLKISACTRDNRCHSAMLVQNMVWTSPIGAPLTRIEIESDDATPCGETRLEDVEFVVDHSRNE